MNRGRLISVILCLWIPVGFSSLTLLAQSPYDPGYAGEAEKIREHIQLFTDRELYAVNESIHFLAEHRVEGPVESSFWSSVLYLELVAPTGLPVAQGKYPVVAGRARGSLRIPEAALSGNYHLKCYSRWMRNRGPASYSYTPVKVVNPFRSEVVAPGGGYEASPDLPRVPYMDGGMECVTSSGVYGKGEEVRLQLSGTLPPYLEEFRGCLTVVPAGAIDLDGGQYITSAREAEQEPYRVSFLPDLGSGVSVSGTVVDAAQEPVVTATLHFSLLGESPDYFATISDENGRFIFSTPAATAQQELFVTPQPLNGSAMEVRIDQEYDARMASLPREKFELSGSEEDLAWRMVLNLQLAREYRTPSRAQEAEESMRESNIPFYGTRVKQLKIDDYVRLPNLEEVFINLIPEVQFYRKRGEDRIRILSENKSIGIYEPLIMIDHISVFDHEAILALSPDKIERIDLINEVYLKGNVAFGGVLAIHSRNGDMAGIDLPEGSYFFDYNSFYPREEQPADTEPQGSGRIPDTRNTFYWEDHLLLKKGESLEIPFKAPEVAGEYVILVRGTDPDGQVLSARARFRVE
jgi:hypothetical protein